MIILQHKFDEGDVVYDIVRPQQLMIITKRNGFICYCRQAENKKYPELAFMERDLKRHLIAIVPDNLRSKNSK